MKANVYWHEVPGTIRHGLVITSEGSPGLVMDINGQRDNIKDIRYYESTYLCVEQFTGLKDSQGNDIYEGDIVMAQEARFEETVLNEDEIDEVSIKVVLINTSKPLPAPDVSLFTAVVEWNQTMCGWMLRYLTKPEEWSGDTTMLGGPAYVFTVLGNLHENPELIPTDDQS